VAQYSPRQSEVVNTDTQSSISISTEGFASMNTACPPEQLINELNQNSFNSFTDEQSGRIRLSYFLAIGSFEIVF
jgi:hypothetical protein